MPLCQPFLGQQRACPFVMITWQHYLPVHSFCSKSILTVSSDRLGYQHGMHMHDYRMHDIKCCFPSSMWKILLAVDKCKQGAINQIAHQAVTV